MFATLSQAIKPKLQGEPQNDLGDPEYQPQNHNKMAKKTFFIPTRLVFTGHVEVLAEDQEKAECLVQHMMGATLGEITDSGDENVKDWAFPMTGDVQLITEETE